MNRPLLDLGFDCTTFVFAFGGLICLALAGVEPILLGFVGGLASVSGVYAIKSVILWKKSRHERRRIDWLYTMRDVIHHQNMMYFVGGRLYAAGPLDVRHSARQHYNVNWQRDGF